MRWNRDCQCFKGYSGLACQRFDCPNVRLTIDTTANFIHHTFFLIHFFVYIFRIAIIAASACPFAYWQTSQVEATTLHGTPVRSWAVCAMLAGVVPTAVCKNARLKRILGEARGRLVAEIAPAVDCVITPGACASVRQAIMVLHAKWRVLWPRNTMVVFSVPIYPAHSLEKMEGLIVVNSNKYSEVMCLWTNKHCIYSTDHDNILFILCVFILC